MKQYTILGGGIAGLSTAIALKQKGIQATVFEAAPAIKPLGAGLLLAANAVKGYQHLGIAEKIIARGKLLPTFSIFDQQGRVITSADAAKIGQKYGLHNFAIHRAELHEALLAELEPGQVQTGKRAAGFERLSDGGLEVRFADGSTHRTDYLVVAEGIHSAIRRQLLPDSEQRYAGYTCWRAVVETPPSLKGLYVASETWGPDGRFGIVPLAGDKVYWFACVDAPQNDPVRSIFKVADLQQVFCRFHQPVRDILENTRDHDLIWGDIIDLKPISKFAFGNIVLIGDAAHATTPNLGQGACQAIEDAVVLADELGKNTDPAEAFVAFERRRMERVHFVVNNSWRLGKIAQLSQPWLAGLRNILFRLVPESVNERQLKALLEVDF
ncbi:MAG: monooxygenase [Haliscomenobacteraceae bacterium CHB4]|nr:Aurachin C monooxygenase/isomerase [Saprospiraceae bacterium]MCE7923320.1 monooxygenase [Haliscomenobacteraceae bacterium CHB4]